MTRDRFRPHWLFAVLVVCLVLGIALWPRRQALLPPVIVLDKPYRMPVGKVTLFERWVPATPAWAWLWKLKERLFGGRKPVNFAATILEFKATPAIFLQDLGNPVFVRTSGLQVWLLPDAQLNDLRDKLTQNHEIN